MTRSVFSVVLACLLFTSAGCGGGSGGASGTPGVKVLDAETNYGQAIRVSVLSLQDALRSEGGISTAKGNVESLLESLEGYETKGGAAHKAAYDEIDKTAKELKGLFDSSATPAQIQPKVAQLVAAAEKLLTPGK